SASQLSDGADGVQSRQQCIKIAETVAYPGGSSIRVSSWHPTFRPFQASNGLFPAIPESPEEACSNPFSSGRQKHPSMVEPRLQVIILRHRFGPSLPLS